MNEENIKQWLKEFNHSREWLAKELDVAKKTVNNWLGSERPVPDKAKILIERLMEADRLRDAHGKQVTHSLTLEFNSADFDAIEDAAHCANKKIRTWATDTLRDIATRPVEEIHEEIKKQNLLEAAEDQAPYGKKPNGDVGHSG